MIGQSLLWIPQIGAMVAATEGEQKEPALVLEYLSEKGLEAIRSDIEAKAEASLVILTYGAVREAPREEDRSRTRVVFTGDFIQSVSVREDRDGKEFTLEGIWTRGGKDNAA